MFGFDELFFLWFLPQSLDQSQRKESKGKGISKKKKKATALVEVVVGI